MLDIMHIFCYNKIDYNFLEVLGLQFITTGNRIAVENFTLGDLYTITFTNGTYINSACIGIGENFVSFQRNEPELLFTLNMETAELVSSIDLYAGGTGTNNYNDLTNKPQINDVELVGNKSLSDLGIQPTISDLDTIRSGAAAGATAVQPAALSDYQPIISDLDTIRSGAAAGATAVQPAALADYQPKIDSSHKLDADLVDDTSSTHKFATASQLSQIETNKNNILLLEQANGAKNQINIPDGTYTAGTSSFIVTNGAVTSTATDNTTHATTLVTWTLKAGTYVFYDDTSDLSAVQYRIYQQSPDTRLTPAGQNPATFTLANDTVVYLSCYTFKTGTMTTRPMLMTKAMWDAGFTDYQHYALSNAELTNNILLLGEKYIDKSVANTAKTITLASASQYIITINAYAEYGVFLCYKYNNESSTRLYTLSKSSNFDQNVTVAAEANSNNISITPVSPSNPAWYVVGGVRLN